MRIVVVLPAPLGPSNPEHLALCDLERDAPNRLDTTRKGLAQIAAFQYRHARQSNVRTNTTRKVRRMRGGIDLGGTKIQAVVVDGRSRVLGEHRMPTPKDAGAEGVVRRSPRRSGRGRVGRRRAVGARRRGRRVAGHGRCRGRDRRERPERHLGLGGTGAGRREPRGRGRRGRAPRPRRARRDDGGVPAGSRQAVPARSWASSGGPASAAGSS